VKCVGCGTEVNEAITLFGHCTQCVADVWVGKGEISE